MRNVTFPNDLSKLVMFLTMVIFVLFCQTPPAQAQSCVSTPGGKYARVSQGYYSSPIPAYSDAACTTSDGTVGVGSDGWVYTTSGTSVAAYICLSRLSGIIDVDSLGSGFYKCSSDDDDNDDDDDDDDGGNTSTNRRIRVVLKSGYVVFRADATPPPDLTLHGLRIHAFDGMDSGIQFRRLGAYGIGIQSVLDMGFLDAVDAWSHIGSGYEVCFPQVGRIVFLDAATSPRSVHDVENRHDDEGYTCALLYRAGTLVLVESTESQPATEESTPTEADIIKPGTNDSIDTAIELEDCTVTPLVNLRLRRRPWDSIRLVVPRDTLLSANARTEHWFKVTYDGVTGWLAAWHILSEGDCDWI